MPTELKGVGEMRKALRKFTPDLNKALSKELGGLLRPVANQARGYIVAQPMTNWGKDTQVKFPNFDIQAARRGIGYKTTQGKPNSHGFRSLAEIYNKSASGMIYEMAGRRNPNTQFVKNLERQSPIVGTDRYRGRAIFRAWKEDSGKTQSAVLRAFFAAKRRFYGGGII